MNKIERVKIERFWGDKDVTLNFREDVNFLIGVNGSGKTTIINLIAATLNADFSTLDRFEFKKIHITIKPTLTEKVKKTSFIEVEKTEKLNSPYQNIIFKIKRHDDKEPKTYLLDELEEEQLFRHSPDFAMHRRLNRSGQLERNVNIALKEIVNVSWLSIHRTSSRKREERSFESTIDMKIEELQNDLIKYFSQLNRKYTIETEKFQKYIFESLIDTIVDEDFSFVKNLDAQKEKELLKEIFLLFKLAIVR